MNTDRRAELLAQKISEKVKNAREKAGKVDALNIEVDMEAIKKVLVKNKNYGLNAKQIKVKAELERIKNRPDSKYHQKLAKATVDHIKDQKANGGLVKTGNKLAMTEDYRSSGIKEIEDYVCSKCVPVSNA